MKKTLVLATAFLLATANGIFAETPMKTHRILDRATAEKAFEQLTKNAQQGLLAPNAVVQSKFVAIEEVHLTFPSGTGTGGATGTDGGESSTGNGRDGSNFLPENVPIIHGMRVWFELTDGTLIDPSVYRFSPNEEFFVHVEAAVPVFVLLYQNFPPKKGKEAILAYPVQRFPSSFHVLNPAARTKLPVKFAMDDEYEAEYMSIVVARADWDGIVENVPAAAITAVELARANSPEELAAIYRNRDKGVADISSSVVLTKFADVSKQIGWNEADWADVVEEEVVVVPNPYEGVREENPVVIVPPNRDMGNTEASKPAIADAERTRATHGMQFVLTSHRPEISQWNGTSNEVDEVANYLFTNTGIGLLRIVLNKKEEPLAP